VRLTFVSSQDVQRNREGALGFKRRALAQQTARDLVSRGLACDNDAVSLATTDLVWGVEAIGREINWNRRQTYHLLESGKLPARKFAGRGVASASGLRIFFSNLINGAVA
jgi:hypothetical protein